MPFLRFSRDKRGYENTYLLHTFRREGHSHPRLLYWFRTPPGVGVGRHPLDERAIRAIEESYPNLSFDWSKMLQVRPPPPPEERRRTRSEKSRKQPAKREAAPRRSRSDRQGKAAREKAPVEVPREPSEDAAPVDSLAPRQVESDVPVDVPAYIAPDVHAPDVHEADVHEMDAHDDPNDAEQALEALEDAAVVESRAEPWEHPVVTLMGAEMLTRLRARYAAIQVRIAEKPTDPEALESIQERAEALDPDRWKTVEDAVQGIERFETEADAIKNTLGRRPPRPRK